MYSEPLHCPNDVITNTSKYVNFIKTALVCITLKPDLYGHELISLNIKEILDFVI
jgi:hypothetical protein